MGGSLKHLDMSKTSVIQIQTVRHSFVYSYERDFREAEKKAMLSLMPWKSLLMFNYTFEVIA